MPRRRAVGGGRGGRCRYAGAGPGRGRGAGADRCAGRGRGAGRANRGRRRLWRTRDRCARPPDRRRRGDPADGACSGARRPASPTGAHGVRRCAGNRYSRDRRAADTGAGPADRRVRGQRRWQDRAAGTDRRADSGHPPHPVSGRGARARSRRILAQRVGLARCGSRDAGGGHIGRECGNTRPRHARASAAASPSSVARRSPSRSTSSATPARTASTRAVSRSSTDAIPARRPSAIPSRCALATASRAASAARSIAARRAVTSTASAARCRHNRSRHRRCATTGRYCPHRYRRRVPVRAHRLRSVRR